MREHKGIVLAALVSDLASALMDGSTFGVILLMFTMLSGNVPSAGKLGFVAMLLKAHFPGLRSQLTVMMLTAVVLQVIRSWLTYASAMRGRLLALHAEGSLRARLADEVFRLSYPYVTRYRVGDLANRLVDGARQATVILVAVNVLVLSALLACCYFAAMLVVSTPLTLCAAFLFGGAAVVNRLILRRMGKHSRRVAADQSGLSARVIELVSSIRLVHTFSRQRQACEGIASLNEGIVASGLELYGNWEALLPLTDALLVVAMGMFLVIGFLTASSLDALFLPKLLTMTIVLQRLGNRVRIVVDHVGRLKGSEGARLEMDELLDNPRREYERKGSVLVSHLDAKIAFRHVSFRYEGTDRDAVRDLSFEVNRGKVTALVGASGSGKSSVVDLLLGLRAPSNGEILLDNNNFSDVDLPSWRAILGVVSQDVLLFSESIADNIRYGRPAATIEEIVVAARAANAEEFVDRLPDRYDTKLGDRGSALSGGQRQRIALARALVRNPEILILDEATSALDSESEQLFQRALAKLRGTRTMVVVAHRLSTIADADEILVLHDGLIVERGSHSELLRSDGMYAHAWNLQARTTSPAR